jgi:hypothetical protein
LEYTTIEDVLKMVKIAGPHCIVLKRDIKDAFNACCNQGLRPPTSTISLPKGMGTFAISGSSLEELHYSHIPISPTDLLVTLCGNMYHLASR